MSGEPPNVSGDVPVSDDALAEQERGMRDLFAKARATADAPGETPPRLLPAVQRKLRERSRGKFFGDGWSTSQAHLGHGLIALMMLLIVTIAYFALAPTSLPS
ncbi:MAG TPA: hypothetical protein VNO21_25830 [Polyangiaceae bacterium]|nr:hypothetical protein [Polyangiaceae bacterium]